MRINWRCSSDYFSLVFDQPVRTLSSAILGGGVNEVRGFLNLRVDENFGGKKKDFPSPQYTLAEAAREAGLPESSAGMMTAANMNSFSRISRSVCGIEVSCFLTAGLSNALAAGDPGQFHPQQMYSEPEHSPVGTINIVAGFDCPLTDSALAEAMMIVTEAKSSVLFELGVRSRGSERFATGTGTDSALVYCAPPRVSGRGPEAYCGKHTVLGEVLASVVRKALFESLKKDKLFCQ